MSDTEASIWQIVTEKAAKHDHMKQSMAKAMLGAQKASDRRVIYDRPLDLEFPQWLKSEGTHQ
jgi:hypothetical protein